MTSIRTLAFAGLALAASIGGAAASSSHVAPVPASDFYALYDNSPSTSSSDMANYDHSGTRGRLDLGASAFHPEGPGNVSD
jgi:hypothetical protein